MNQKEKDYLLSIKFDDLTLNTIKKLFAYSEKAEPMLEMNASFVLDKGKLYNDKPVTTTAGRYIFNLILGEKILSLLGYQNDTFNSDVFTSFYAKVCSLLLTDKITTQEFKDFFDRIQFFFYNITLFIAPGYNEHLIETPDCVKKRKKELFKEYQKEIENGEPIKSNEIERELIKLAVDEIKKKDKNALDLYDAKANKGSINNNLKNTIIMRGAVPDTNNPGKFIICEENLEGGINKKNYHVFSNIGLLAVYGKSKETQRGGYMEKEINAAYQSVILDKEGSECGTNTYNQIELTDKNYKEYMFRYVIDRNQLVCLTDDNKDKYVGRYVKMRSPMFCKSEKFCNKCIGEMPYKLGLKNLGLTVSVIGSNIKNKSMKKIHDMSIDIIKIDNVDDYIF